MATLTALSDRLWTGAEPMRRQYMALVGTPIEEIAPGVAMVAAFGNVMPVRTDDGLVLVDTSSALAAATVYQEVRSWSPAPVRTAVFTHGHVDHVGGLVAFEDEARARRERIHVVAHEVVCDRFDRYVATRGYNSVINQRQFAMPDYQWPGEWRYPDETFRERLDLHVGGLAIELHHARGETDDHAWVWVPERKCLFPGDLFIWAVPNAGNPQKVQRYAAEWAVALRAMAACGAEVMLPSHGLPIIGADRVRRALEETAELLESLHGQTLALMNAGARLNDVLHTVRAPAHLLERPYLQPIYDDPEFVVRNVWRLYGGWYDGNPAELKPAPTAALAAELATLAGGASRLAARARELAAAGELRLAGHLAEFAAAAAPDDATVHAVRAEVNTERVRAETSLMAKAIFRAAADDSGSRSGRK